MRGTQEPGGLILIVEDNRNISEMVGEYLEGRGFEVDYAADGLDGYRLASENTYDVIVLDLMLPRLDGIEVCRRLREEARKSTPVLMLTARDTLDEKLTGLESGADDYLTKPFDMRELVLRLRALNRRRAVHRPPVLKVADLQLDPFRREVYRAGRYVPLTRKQFAVLEVLMSAGGGVVSSEELLERAWDENTDPFTNAVRITVSALRKRLGEPVLIATVPGVGYQIEAGASDPEQSD